MPYDAHLIAALRELGVSLTPWIAGGLPEQREHHSDAEAMLDIAGRLPGRWKIRKYAKAAEYAVNMLALQRHLRREHVGVLHIQWLPFLKRLPSIERWHLRRARAAGARLVYTVHNVLPHDTGRRHADTFGRVYRFVDALICHTHRSRRRLMEDFDVNEESVWVIPHGPLDTGTPDVPPKEARATLGYAQDTPVVLFFGRLEPYKGVVFLLRAWRQVVEEHPNARLVIAGSGDHSHLATLSALIKDLGLEAHTETHFYFVPERKLGLMIQAADVLVYPYKNITQSGALLAGMNAGKAIVATNVGGFRETIEHGRSGLLVDYGDETALARQITALLQDPEKKVQMGKAARERLRTRYAWSSIAARTAACYAAVSGA